jgi:2-succinyl-6-hydroxy-2,4-cyclohexadiene-1-carboxylate synthase
VPSSPPGRPDPGSSAAWGPSPTPAVPPALHAEASGPVDGPPLVLAHGFTQTGRLWGRFGEVLAAHHRLVRVDLPGHGGSAGVRADLPSAGDLLLAAAPGDGPVDVLGYSLGARVALHAALRHPGRVRRLVLVGGTPGIEDPAARARRRQRDGELADGLERSGDLEGFLRRWLAAPMFAGLRSPDLAERLRNTAAGLASSLRLAGTGAQEPRWADLPALAVPVLVVAGAADLRFASVGDRMARALPAGALALVPGAGHAAHLEQPDLTARIVLPFLGTA